MTGSADGTCRLYDLAGGNLKQTKLIEPGLGPIAAGEFVASNTSRLVLAHKSGAAEVSSNGPALSPTLYLDLPPSIADTQ